MIYDWRTSDLVRRASLDDGLFSYASHCIWFDEVQADENRHLLIGVADDEPAAVIRFDRAADATYEVSIFLNPEFLGRGIGGATLLCAEEWLGKYRSRSFTILAAVRPENQPSRTMFERCGYIAEPGTQFSKKVEVR